MPETGGGLLPAFILAAGFGTRLRPLSDHLAKPLLPVLGRTLLERAADRARAAGASVVAINAHHRAEDVARVARALGRHAPTALFHEGEILGTGGALANARPLLSRAERFLLHNGDVLSDADLGVLLEEHRRSGALATLLLVDWPQVNTVTLGPDGSVTAVGASEGTDAAAGERRRLTYTGIAAFERSFLDLLPEGPSSLVDALRRALAGRPRSVRGFAPRDLFWSDLGTVRRYLDAVAWMLDHDPGAERHGEARVFRAEGADLSAGAAVSGFAALERGARVTKGAALAGCVVLEGVAVPAGTKAERAVIGPGWTVTEADNDLHRLRDAGDAVAAGRREAPLLVEQGSDRSFRRIREGELSAVLLCAPPEDPEFERYAAVGEFLFREDFGGPAIFAVNPAARTVLMEDLGDRSLHAAALEAGEDGRRALYEAALDRLVDLQVRGTRLVEAGGCAAAGDRLFDHETLRWETGYFRRRFLLDTAGVDEEEASALDPEFERLAATVLEQPVALMHRDFQSQNLLLDAAGEVRLVDFQGMRRGPLLYDAMSLLRDAYLELEPALRDGLLEGYRARLAAAGGPAPDPARFRAMAVAAGLQRNMQALGAFGYLSGVKGKVRYREHVPAGLRHLGQGLAETPAAGLDLPRLTELVERVRRAWSSA